MNKVLLINKRLCGNLQTAIKVGQMFDVISQEERGGCVYCVCKDVNNKQHRINSNRFEFSFLDGNLSEIKKISFFQEVKRRKKEHIQAIKQDEAEKRNNEIKKMFNKVKNETQLKELDLTIRLTEVLVVKRAEQLCDRLAAQRIYGFKKITRNLRAFCAEMHNRWRQCKFDDGVYEKFEKASIQFESMMKLNITKIWFTLNSWVKNKTSNFDEVKTDALIVSMLYLESRKLYNEFCLKLNISANVVNPAFVGIYNCVNEISGLSISDYKDVDYFMNVIHNEFRKTKFCYTN
jgi:hypothetical protein